MGLGCGVLVLLWIGHSVLAVGSSWLLCELRRNVSLYMLFAIDCHLLYLLFGVTLRDMCLSSDFDAVRTGNTGSLRALAAG